jgi:hypothetical protein
MRRLFALTLLIAACVPTNLADWGENNPELAPVTYQVHTHNTLTVRYEDGHEELMRLGCTADLELPQSEQALQQLIYFLSNSEYLFVDDAGNLWARSQQRDLELVSLTMAFDGWVLPQDDCPFYPPLCWKRWRKHGGNSLECGITRTKTVLKHEISKLALT